MVKEVLCILRQRLSDLDTALAELAVTQPPPGRTPTAAQLAQRKAEKARKLAELEARRTQEARQRREAARARYFANRAAAEAAAQQEMALRLRGIHAAHATGRSDKERT